MTSKTKRKSNLQINHSYFIMCQNTLELESDKTAASDIINENIVKSLLKTNFDFSIKTP